MTAYSRPKRFDLYIPYARVNCLKTIPFTAAHTYKAHKLYDSTRPGIYITVDNRVGKFPFSINKCNVTDKLLPLGAAQ